MVFCSYKKKVVFGNFDNKKANLKNPHLVPLICFNFCIITTLFFLGIPGLPCPCCPPRLGTLPESIFSTAATPVSSILSNSTPSLLTDSEGLSSKPKADSKEVLFTASVAELRRKAQEHSAAIWQSLQQFQHNSDKTSSELPDIPKDLAKVPLKEDLK